MPSADLSRLTAIVHTSERPAAAGRLVHSVRRAYPELRLLVADDSRQSRPVEGADWIRVAPGVGIGAARNAALARVRTPYFLLLEDTLDVSRRSRVESLLELVAHGQVDIAAGDCVRCERRLVLLTRRTPAPVHATFEFLDGGLTLKAGHRLAAEGRLAVDVAHNFFVARTDRIRSIGGWDPQLMADERLEFFVRAQRFGLRVGVVPEAIASRWPAPAATNPRTPVRDFTTLAMTKMGVSRLTDLDGRTREAARPARAA